MKNLILHPTDISQWHALVSEAESSTQIALNENIESYLVFLLQRFVQTPQLAESILATDFLESMASFGKKHIEQLIVIGDKSLLLAGLFPGIAVRRNVNIEYYTDMGQAAYLSASALQKKPKADLYLELSKHFPNMQSILQAIRGDFQQFDNQNLQSFSLNNDSHTH